MEIKGRIWDEENKHMLDWYDIRNHGLYMWNENERQGFGITMLWTGLLDTSKKEIYDGDIVLAQAKYLSHQRYLVVWDKARCGFYLKPLGSDRANYDKYYRMNVCKLTIVGDKYRNLELLTKEYIKKMGGLQ